MIVHMKSLGRGVACMSSWRVRAKASLENRRRSLMHERMVDLT